MPRAASMASLQAGIARLRKKWSLPPMKRSRLGHRRRRARPPSIMAGSEVAQQHERAGPVAVVRLVAHLDHLAPGSRSRRPAACARTAACSSGPSTSPIQRSRVEHVGRVRAVAQHLAQALVERAVGLPPGRGVVEDEHPHRRRHHARHRPDGAVVVAGSSARSPSASKSATASSGSLTSRSSAAAPISDAAQRPEVGPSMGGPGVQELAALQSPRLHWPGRRRRARRAPRSPGAALRRWRRRGAIARHRREIVPRCPASAAASPPSMTLRALGAATRRRAGRRRC